MNCNDARLAIDSAFDTGVPLAGAARMHADRCQACGEYGASLEAIDRALRESPPVEDDAALVARIQASLAAQPPHLVSAGTLWTSAATLAGVAAFGGLLSRYTPFATNAWWDWLPRGPVLPEWSYLKQDFQAIPAAIVDETGAMLSAISMAWSAAGERSLELFGGHWGGMWATFLVCLAGAFVLNSLEWVSRRTHR